MLAFMIQKVYHSLESKPSTSICTHVCSAHRPSLRSPCPSHQEGPWRQGFQGVQAVPPPQAQGERTPPQKPCVGVSRWHSRLRTRHCHCSGSGCCCATGLIPGSETSMCCKCNHNNNHVTRVGVQTKQQESLFLSF